jgi:hypothetical protein
MTLIQILENTADLKLKATSASYYLDSDLVFSYIWTVISSSV